MTLALQLCQFPQGCMRSDRLAAYYSTFDATSATDAFRYEYETGLEQLREAVLGRSTNVAIFFLKFNPFPHSKYVTSGALLHDLLAIWLQKSHTAVAIPTHFNVPGVINLSIFMGQSTKKET